MCGGIAVQWKTIPQNLREQYGIAPTKIGTEERVIQFHFRDRKPLLPAFRNSALDLYPWGNRDDKELRLPRTGWCRLESSEQGKWDYLKPEPVEIPAIMGLEKGVWFEIDKGIKGILVNDETEAPHVYMLTQSASPEYIELTKHERMPVFTGGWSLLSL
ncbi:hypothetical protein KKC44_02255 [Patescibacteria group bacterium]|nr:hypothetical protein [Patescibacteria group bacterium]MBU2259406.1 hypothetical protein [Patescibacteria group bacterium]